MKQWQEFQGVYIHIPFCLQKCRYCDFVSYAGCSDSLINEYVQALVAEIAQRSLPLPINAGASVYFGGGTPSLLANEDLARIVTALKDSGIWQNPCEVTIEVNPATATLEKMLFWRGLGIDRISIGVQSLNDEELRLAGRLHNAAAALETIATAQKAGFAKISCDLIYGLPGQSAVSFADGLQRLLQGGIKHISLYNLMVEEETPLAQMLQTGALALPEEDAVDEMYDLAQSITAAYGLERYEISNYAMPGAESKHNLVYWQYLPYLAFGCAACSFVQGRRLTGYEGLTEYIGAVKAGRIAGVYESIEEQVALEEFVFMGLRTAKGISLATAKARFGCDLREYYRAEIEATRTLGLVELNTGANTLKLTAKGMRYCRRVFEIFVKS